MVVYTECITQGSLLGPVLLTIYTSDIDQNVHSHIIKFADDTKVFQRRTSNEDIRKPQEDLQTLVKWSNAWQIVFIISKCKVVNMRNKQSEVEYTMNEIPLYVQEKERYMTVNVHKSLKCGII